MNSIINAKIYPVNSKENTMDDFIRKNVPGADVAESSTEDDGTVQYSFVSEDKSFDKERTVEEREYFLSNSLKQLFPNSVDDNNEEIHENDDIETENNPDADIDISSDGASKRGNEVYTIFPLY